MIPVLFLLLFYTFLFCLFVYLLQEEYNTTHEMSLIVTVCVCLLYQYLYVCVCVCK